MNSRELPIPGGREVRATLDSPDDETDLVASADAVPGSRCDPAGTSERSRSEDDAPERAGGHAVAIACPPHPQHRGHRGDDRLVAVSEHLVEHDLSCLRFDYGDWDEGYGELEDARNALRWADERYDRVGILGFSFGGAIAALAAASTQVDLAAVSLLAPASRLAEDLDAADALDDATAPIQVVYGARDKTAEWRPLVARARELDCTVVEMSADHFFIGQHDKVAATVGGFLVDHLS